MAEFYKYIYDGPVLEFGTCVADHWRGETMAPSENKARSNLKYQYKKQNNTGNHLRCIVVQIKP